MSDLLHEALNRQMTLSAQQQSSSSALSPTRSPPMLSPRLSAQDHPSVGGGPDDDDDAYTPVHTRPTSPVPGTSSRSSHRSNEPASPTKGGRPVGSRSSSPSRLAKKRMAEEQERRSSRDPLRRFESHQGISSRIFRELGVVDLARCMRVCKRWNRSATINWCWYLRFQEARADGPLNIEPIWTRRESKENWAQRFRSAFTLNGLQYQTVFEQEYEKARSDGYLTPKEEREQRWADEAAATAGYGGTSSNLHTVFGGDKLAAREFYKSLGGRSKVKGTGRLGTSSPGIRDRTMYGDGGDYDD